MYDNDLNQDLTYVERNPEVPMPEDNGKKNIKRKETGERNRQKCIKRSGIRALCSIDLLRGGSSR